MPSPFPGMDPFLEHPEVFPGLHASLVFCLLEALQPKLPKRYYAVIERREWLEVGNTQRVVIPDVHVRQKRPDKSGNGALAVATLSPGRTKPSLVRVPREAWRQTSIKVFHKYERLRELITTIEVLSPSNKRLGSEGRRLYLEKQRELLQGNVSLVELDLLREGEHTTLVPPEYMEKVKPRDYDYHVCVSRYYEPGDFLVYAFTLPSRLPEFLVPLHLDEPGVMIDLEAVFARAYEAGAYERYIEYQKPSSIVPPLRPDQARWARQVLRTKGHLRSSRGE